MPSFPRCVMRAGTNPKYNLALTTTTVKPKDPTESRCRQSLRASIGRRMNQTGSNIAELRHPASVKTRGYKHRVERDEHLRALVFLLRTSGKHWPVFVSPLFFPMGITTRNWKGS